MKPMVKILIGLLLFTWVCCTFKVEASEFKLQISPSKEIYLEAEPIWLDVTLTNISQDTARAWGLCVPCQSGFEVIVRDENGDTLEFSGPLYEMTPGPGWIMKPGESYYQCVNISEYFGKLPEPRGVMAGFLFTKSLRFGKFLANARRFIRGQAITSNEVKFEVKPPASMEKKAYLLLEEAYILFGKGKQASSNEKLYQIIRLYPKSIYVQNACRDLFLWDMLIQKFPDSGFTQNALLAIASQKNEQDKKEFLEEVVKDHPKTRSAKFAQQMLRGW